MLNSGVFIILGIFAVLVSQSSALWCYQCVSTQPGCGTPFNWLWHWTKVCPEDDDVCVKIIEEKDGLHISEGKNVPLNTPMLEMFLTPFLNFFKCMGKVYPPESATSDEESSEESD